MRYEDDFGSFWMVDDAEFMKRRHLSRGRPRKYEPGNTVGNASAVVAQQQQPLPPQQPGHAGQPQQQKSADVVTSTNVPTSLATAAATQFKLAGSVGSQ